MCCRGRCCCRRRCSRTITSCSRRWAPIRWRCERDSTDSTPTTGRLSRGSSGAGLRRGGGVGAFAGFQEAHVGEFAADVAELPGALREEDSGTVAVFGHLAAIAVAEFLYFVGRAGKPARGLIRRGFEVDVETVFGL